MVTSEPKMEGSPTRMGFHEISTREWPPRYPSDTLGPR